MCDANVFIIINDSIWFWCDVAARTATVTRKLQCSLRDLIVVAVLWPAILSLRRMNEQMSVVRSGIRKSAYCYFGDFVKMWNETKLWFAPQTDWDTHTRRTAPKDNYDLAIKRNGIRISEVKEILTMPIDAESYLSLVERRICVFRAIESYRLPSPMPIGTNFHHICAHLPGEESTRWTKGR